MARRAPLQLYRKSELGSSLTDSLEELMEHRNLPEDLAWKILAQFDQSMNEALSQKTRAKVHISGHLHTYRFCDNVWTFIVENANFRMENETVQSEKVKIVACDGTR